MFGVAWALLQPCATLLVFYILFGKLLAMKLPGIDLEHGYLLYLLCGLAVWLPLSDAMGRGAGSLVAYEDFLRKQPIPAEILPLTSVGGTLVLQFLGYVAILVVAYSQGVLTPSVIWWLPLMMLAQIVMTVGFTLLLSMASFLWRDLVSMMPFMMQILFYCTPVVYPIDQVPHDLKWLFLANPVACMVMVLQSLVFHQAIEVYWLLSMLFWMFSIGLGGWIFFKSMRPVLGEAL